MKRIRLQDSLEIETTSGRVYRLEAAGTGFSVHPMAPVSGPPEDNAPRLGGRRPSRTTLALRGQLEADAADGVLEPTQAYLEWFQEHHPEISKDLASARIRRERQRLVEQRPGLRIKKQSGAGRTRKAKPTGPPVKESTLALQAKLEADATVGRLGRVRDYVVWLLEQEEGLGEATARQRVYNVRRAVLEDHSHLKPSRRERSADPSVQNLLREQMRHDTGLDGPEAMRRYVRFALAHDRDLSLNQARKMVSQELGWLQAV